MCNIRVEQGEKVDFLYFGPVTGRPYLPRTGEHLRCGRLYGLVMQITHEMDELEEMIVYQVTIELGADA